METQIVDNFLRSIKGLMIIGRMSLFETVTTAVPGKKKWLRKMQKRHRRNKDTIFGIYPGLKTP